MTAATVALNVGRVGKVITGGPKKIDKAFWKSYWEFVALLRVACPPHGITNFVRFLMGLPPVEDNWVNPNDRDKELED